MVFEFQFWKCEVVIEDNAMQDIINQEEKIGLSSVKLKTKKANPDISEQYEN